MRDRKLRDIDVLRKCDLVRATLNKIQRGGNVNVDTLISLAYGLGVPVGYFFDEEPAGVTTNGDYSAGAVGGNATVNVGDAVLMERIKWMEAMLNEKDERIRDLQSRLTSTH